MEADGVPPGPAEPVPAEIVHDGVQQRLVTQALMLSVIRDKVLADVRADVDEVRQEMTATLQGLRDLCQGVHPAILTEVGLGAAVRALARRSPLPVRVQARTGGRLPGSCEVTAYYVAAEAFTNAAEHASASVDILIEQAGGTLTVLLPVTPDDHEDAHPR
jgi:signal transduction histidine kinase